MSAERSPLDADLTSQVALVTGAGRGIGRAIAVALAEAGAVVAVAARSEGQLAETVAMIEDQGGKGIALPTDVADEQAVRRMVDETIRQLGPIDLLVSNAGVSQAARAFWETPPADWWRVVEVNLKGVVLCAHAVLPGMIARRRGRIVNVGSYAGVRPEVPNTAYSVSKTGVLRFSEGLALETRPYGVSVFAISPGHVHTAMTDRQWQSVPESERVESVAPTANPTTDWSPPELAARLVVYLASGQADGLSGRFIHARADDVLEMVQRVEEIEQNSLYTLRVRKLA